MKQEHITAAGARTALTIKDPSIVFVLQGFLETVSVAQVRNFLFHEPEKDKKWREIRYIDRPNLRNAKCTCMTFIDRGNDSGEIPGALNVFFTDKERLT